MKGSEASRWHPIGWANFSSNGLGVDHWFGTDGISLCRRHRNHTYNILSRETASACVTCQRRLSKEREGA